MKRALSITWFLVALCVLPAVLNLELLSRDLFIAANWIGSFLMMRRYARDWFIN